ncbi:MAG: hypothetical protein KJO24_07115, partial [Gammaproteobacteria bacterium]|nr:hypothetical protein [Gammaproteobacteria bacterium]
MKKILLSVLIITLASCASTRNMPLSGEALTQVQGQSLTVVERESPAFVAMTSGKGMFAVAGVGAAVAAGNKLVEENSIEDPAKSIGAALATQLHKQHGLHFAGVSASVAKSDKLSAISQLAGNSKYALDVATNGWSYMYDGFNFSDYYVGYSAKIRLIDVVNGKVVSSGMCI